MTPYCPIFPSGRQLLCALPLLLLAAWGRAQCETLPELGMLPAETVYFSCSEGRDVRLDGLAGEVSRCYRITAAGELEAGSLHPALADRLARGGATPLATDDCGRPLEVCVRETILSGSPEACADSLRLRRSFTVRVPDDPFPTGVSGSYELLFLRPALAAIDALANVVHTDCPGDGISPDYRDPEPDHYPYFETPGGRRYLRPGSCDYTVFYTDEERTFGGCGESFRYQRIYRVIDDCSGERTFFWQTVRVGDWLGPVITNPDSVALQVTTNAGCAAVFDPHLPGFSAIDDCTTDPTVVARIYPDADLQQIPYGPYVVRPDSTVLTDSLPSGNYLIRYTARDDCGNVTFRGLPLTVADRTPPTVRCRTTLDRELAGTGTTQIRITDLDLGSGDDCAPITLYLQRTDTAGDPSGPAAPTLNLTCTDLPETTVALVATDSSGNRAHCLSRVRLADEQAPVCTPPPATQIDCRDFAADFPTDLIRVFRDDPLGFGQQLDDRFGTPAIDDNCADVRVTQLVTGNLNDCGIGQLVRIFSARDVGGNLQTSACVQTIDVLPFHQYAFRLPASSTTGCGDTPQLDSLTGLSTGCDLFGLNVVTDTVAAADGCYRLNRQLDFINWCEYDGQSDPIEIPTHQELRYLRVAAGPSTQLSDDRLLFDRDGDPTNGNDLGEAIANYGDHPGRGAFRYRFATLVTDDTAPTFDILPPQPGLVFDQTCRSAIIVDFAVLDDCADPQLRVEIDLLATDGNGDGRVDAADFTADRLVGTDRFTDPDGTGNRSVNVNDLTVGLHLARFTATDACGNQTDTVLQFPVEDGFQPVPACAETVNVPLLPDLDMGGRADLSVWDLITEEVPSCSGGEVRYSIYSEEEAGANGFLPAPGREELTLDCGMLGDVPVRIYAFAEGVMGNGFCVTVATVTAEENVCSGRLGSIAGRVLTRDGDPMGNLEVANIGQSVRFTRTDADGRFDFAPLTELADYTVQPFNDRFPANGVSTRDILLINAYLLRINTDLSPYQLIAADVNRNRAVTVRDLIEIRRVILRLSTDFTGNTSWRFVPSDYVFPDPENPWVERFPEVRNFNQLFGHNVANFVAIKTGDVSGNAVPTGGSGPSASEIRGRSNEAVTFELRPTETDGRYAVHTSGTQLTGFQGTLTQAGGDAGAMHFEPGQVGPEYCRRDPAGRLHLSYAPLTGTATTEDGSPLFYLTGLYNPDDLVLADGGGAGGLHAEAYLADFRAVPLRLALAPTPGDNPGTAALYPNPFRDETTLNIDWPQPEDLTVEAFDLSGRRLYRGLIAGRIGRQSVPLPMRGKSVNGPVVLQLTGVDSGEVIRVMGYGFSR